MLEAQHNFFSAIERQIRKQFLLLAYDRVLHRGCEAYLSAIDVRTFETPFETSAPAIHARLRRTGDRQIDRKISIASKHASRQVCDCDAKSLIFRTTPPFFLRALLGCVTMISKPNDDSA
jgi:hypothetical protein